MVKKVIVLAFFVGIFNSSCRNIPVLPVTANNTDTFNIALDLRNTFNIWNLIDSVSYTSLEKVGEETLTNIRKVIIQDSTMYILDNVLNKNIYVFSVEGKFLRKFGAGKITAEIKNFHCFNNRIVVYDDKRGVLNFFDSQGRYLKEVHIGFRGADFILLDDNLMAFYTRGLATEMYDNSHMLVYMDSMGRVKSKGLPVTEGAALQSHKNDNLFFYHNGQPHCMPSLQNNVYRLTGETINNVAYFNFGRFNLSLDFLGRNISYENIYSYPFVIQIKRVLSTNHFTQIVFAVQGKEGYALFKKEDNQIMASGINIMTDKNSDFLSPVPLTVNGNSFISIVLPSAIISLKNNYQANIRDHIGNRWRSLGLDTVNITDNPVIMRYTIKKP